MEKHFNRADEDLGNIVHLEHVNVTIPDQRLSTLFYITGMGFTRDPYLITGVVNMWVNVGRSQFHLPTMDPQVLRGTIGIVTPDLDSLARRLEMVREPLEGTKFGFKVHNDRIEATCPWGNRFRCHAPEERFGRTALGIPYIEFDVPEDSAKPIARFYRKIMGASATVEKANGAAAAHVSVGNHQEMIFRETDKKAPRYDGHHIQVYIVDFSGPHKKLAKHGLVSQEDNQHQYRFRDIVDLDSGKTLFTIEHEIRSLTHPLYGRPLANRNPDQTNNAFAAGHETRSWSLPYEA